jgi:hypothetical protein
MPDACPSACKLHFAALEVLKVAHAVLVFKCAIDDVAEDEEFGVRVCAKASTRLDPVFVDHSERAK